MPINVCLRMMAILLVFLPIAGAGHADDEIPPVIRYELYSFRASQTHTVIFNHAEHAGGYRIACIRCHHTLEEGATAVEENCVDCHADTDLRKYFAPRPSMSPEKRLEYHILALHDQCITCHKEIRKSDSYAVPPVACFGCHVREKK